MVNLNRQIGVTQARQGGFSAHVLPQPVGYQPPQPQVIYASGGRMRTSGGMLYSAWNNTTREYAAGEDIYADLSIPAHFNGETVSVVEWFFNGLALATQTAFRQRVYSATGGPFSEPAKAPVGILATGGSPSAGQIQSGTTDVIAQFPIETGQDWTLESWSSTVGPGGGPLGDWTHVAVASNAGSVSGWLDGAEEAVAGQSAVLNGVTFNWAISSRIYVSGFGVDYMGQSRFSPFARYSGATITVPTAPFIAV